MISKNTLVKNIFYFFLIFLLIIFYLMICYFVVTNKNSYAYDCYYKRRVTQFFAGNGGLDVELGEIIFFSQQDLNIFPNGEINSTLEKFTERNCKRYNLQYLGKGFEYELVNDALNCVYTSNGSLFFRIKENEVTSTKIEVNIVCQYFNADELTIYHNGKKCVFESNADKVKFFVEKSEKNELHISYLDDFKIKSILFLTEGMDI